MHERVNSSVCGGEYGRRWRGDIYAYHDDPFICTGLNMLQGMVPIMRIRLMFRAAFHFIHRRSRTAIRLNTRKAIMPAIG